MATTRKKTAKKTTAKKATPAKRAATTKAKAATTQSAKSKTSAQQPAKPKVAKRKASGEGKLSAIDAAARVLTKSKEPMNTKQMIEAMSAQGLWTSPGRQDAARNSLFRNSQGDKRQGEGRPIREDRPWALQGQGVGP